MSIVTHASAGVYTSVVDQSQFQSAVAQVSIGAEVFFAEKGPVDQIVKINNGQGQYVQKFGTPDINIGYGGHVAVQALT